MSIPAKKYLLLFLGLLSFISLSAQKLAFQTTMRQSKPFVFLENKGQLADEKGNVLTDISYYASLGGVNIYCKKDRIAFVFSKVENDSTQTISKTTDALFMRQQKLKTEDQRPETISASRLEMQFLNANPSPQTISDDPQEYYENYYLAHCHDGITAHAFKKITYKNIYNNIDLVLTCNTNGLEYSFVVFPGGDVNDIKIQWNGADSLNQVQGGFRFSNGLGNITESGLKGFLKGNNQAIETRYSFVENQVGFEVGKYDKNVVLVIDPTLVWATYLGGSGNEKSYGVCTDTIGSVFIAGYTSSTTAIATSGAYQTSLSGGINDVFISKFDNKGKLILSTYYGGSGSEEASAICIDLNGNIYITGNTSSTKGIATSGTYQTSGGGSANDAFIAKFTNSCKLLWGTYYGGSNYDYGNSICLDPDENIYISGRTSSMTGIATSGAFQTSGDGNFEDAFLAKFNNQGQLKWATYFGGKSNDEALSVCSDFSGNVYISGMTNSTNNIATSGAYQTSNGGKQDAFIAKFKNDGTLIWSTYYGGSDNDGGWSINSDRAGNLFIAGFASSIAGIASSGSYQSTFSGGYGGFLSKFSSSGHLIWGTYYGGVSVFQLCINNYGQIYITGWTYDVTGKATSDGYQTAIGGDGDAYVAKFNTLGQRKWATYYGGKNYDDGWGISADMQSNIYLTGSTQSSNQIATSGSYQTSSGGISDAFLAKFSFKIKYDAGVKSITSPIGPYCSTSKSLIVDLKNYGTTELDSVKINWSVNGKIQKQYYWTGKLATDSIKTITIDTINLPPGIDTIRAWTSLPNGYNDSVPENDSAMIIDTVYVTPSAKTIGNIITCRETTVSIGGAAISNHSYNWTSNPVGFISTLSSPSIVINKSITYYLTEKDTITGCKNSDSAQIIFDGPSGDAGGNRSVCYGDSLVLGHDVYGNNGYYFNWYSPSGFSSTRDYPKISPKVTGIYYLTIRTSGNVCFKTDSVIITVLPKPTINAGTDTSVCKGTNIQLGGKQITGYLYSWSSNPAGFNSSISDPVTSPEQKTSYNLIVTDSSGCKNSASVTIAVNPLPTPNAGKNQWICPGRKAILGDTIYDANDDFSWSSVPAGFTKSGERTTDTPKVTTQYFLTETIPSTGCTATDTVAIFAYPKPSPSISGKDRICGTDPQIFSTPDNPGSAWNWILKTGTIISGKDSNSISAKPDFGQDTIFVTETNTYGCSATASKTVIVHPKPDARFNLLSDSPSSVFKALDSTEQYYAWDLGDGTTGHYDTITHHYLFTKDSFVHVTLNVASAFGCTSTYDSLIKIRFIPPEKFNIQVYPNPFLDKTEIHLDLDKAAHIQIVVFDAIGRYIASIADINQAIGKKVYVLDGNKYQLAAGVYFLKILVDEKVYVRVVVKIH